eukprot:CAMPEP_0118925638 /NCGR_PEP_ID=MMETSP1169-20130426/3494_1 /TAXON_ID=36882 /ORGANISM="Pyramimonas obovata, Strain CCMP722" /LENGTH=259 /DNA_ID=CAMNT_0006866991 /DNA_START=89 /DNA_END=868 /DNA_ORIENTATION=-
MQQSSLLAASSFRRSATKRHMRLASSRPASRSASVVSASAKYELLYFNARGAAETCRYLFAIADKEYEDNRYKFSFVEGKPQVEERHGEDKAAGKFAQNLDRLPLLKVGDAVIGQSKAIERYLAAEFNLMGADAIEAAQVDAFCEHIRDISTAFGRERGNPFGPMTDETKAKLDVWYAETLPGWYARLEKVAGDSFAVGAALSLADVTLHQLVTAGQMGADPRAAAALEGYPKLKALMDAVAALPSVKAWEAERPETMF